MKFPKPIVIFSITLPAVIALISAYYWLFGEPLFFTTQGDRQYATFQRNGKSYQLSRFESDGSGNYTHYTLSTLDQNNQPVEQEFTTCGRFKLQSDRILFVEPYEFHCGLLTTPFNELTRRSPVAVFRF